MTGANSGIGKATATALAKQGFQVTLVVRDLAKGKAAKADIVGASPGAQVDLLECDLASQASIRGATQRFLETHSQLDVLVCSAGVFLPDRIVTPDGLEATFATNVMGYFLMTQGLLPALKAAAPSRVVFVSSKYGGVKIPFDDLQVEMRKYHFLKATPPTMLGRVLLMQEFAGRLHDDGVVVNAVHPGLVAKTQLLQQTGGFFRWMTNLVGKTPEEGAATVVWLATAPEAAGKTGKLWHKKTALPTPGQGSDPAVRQRFWDECERLGTPKQPARRR